jgi:hypothetical protein
MPYDAAGRKKPKRRIMRTFKLDELSAVDHPAQEGARAVLLKRGAPAQKNGGEYEAPAAVMTNAVEGHAHLVYLRGRAGETSWATSADADSGHGHPWVLGADGTLTIGESEGHSHEVDQAAVVSALLAEKNAGASGEEGDEMAAKANPATPASGSEGLEAVVAENATLKARLEQLEAVTSLTAPQRAHFDGLDEAGRSAFLAKSAGERDADLERAAAAAAQADPVVYKADDGTEFRKSDDPRLVSLAKRGDEDRRARKVAEQLASDAQYEKRVAAEIPHVAGSVSTRVAMLRAIDSIEDEAVRKEATEALHAQNAQMATAFEEHGVRREPAAVSAEAQLDQLAEEVGKAQPTLTPEQAYAKAIETPAGRALYAKVVQAGAAH